MIREDIVVRFGDDDPVVLWQMDRKAVLFVLQAIVTAGHYEDGIHDDLRAALQQSDAVREVFGR